MTKQYDLGLIGLAVMGQNLVLNMVDHGFDVAVFNRTTSKVDEFMSSTEVQSKGDKIVGCHSLKELVSKLKRPRKVMLMIQSKDPVPTSEWKLFPEEAAVDSVLKDLFGMLEPGAGDVIIDGGNTHFMDTERRTKVAWQYRFLFVGTGVSGGEEGARFGPSIMPGGMSEAWPLVKDILQLISAKVGPNKDIPCCDWIGPGGAGHYVKMVHNGIEYGDMQLICEAYWVLKMAYGASNEELYDVFTEWNQGELDSYLIEITRDIFGVKDKETGEYLVDLILDTAGAKGTGKWMSQHALNLGTPSMLVTQAVFTRSLSAMKDFRVRASQMLTGPPPEPLVRTGKYRESVIEQIRRALYAAKICSYAQGFAQLTAAAKENNWPLNFGNIAMLWRGGCIIRAKFLERIKEAFDADPNLENLLLDPYFKDIVTKSQEALRNVIHTAIDFGLPVPAFTAALMYYDCCRSAKLPANLLQAQRDYFGAHTYRRTDKPGEGTFHTDWIEAKKQAAM